jgi:hypothetical protein
MKNILALTVHRLNKTPETIHFDVRRMFNAGWAGRDKAALEHHIRELAEHGISPPRHVPTLFALGNHLLTSSDSIQVHGDQTSGEIEYVLLWHQGELLVSMGSDHTDRRLEAHSIPKAKNMCLNVLGPDLWPWKEVRSHWEQIELTCHVTRQGVQELYQQDSLASLLEPDYWINDLSTRLGSLSDGLVLFSGTIGTKAGLITGEAYAMTMHDPVLNRTIRHTYTCEVLTGAIEDY